MLPLIAVLQRLGLPVSSSGFRVTRRVAPFRSDGCMTGSAERGSSHRGLDLFKLSSSPVRSLRLSVSATGFGNFHQRRAALRNAVRPGRVAQPPTRLFCARVRAQRAMGTFRAWRAESILRQDSCPLPAYAISARCYSKTSTTYTLQCLKSIKGGLTAPGGDSQNLSALPRPRPGSEASGLSVSA